MASQCLYKTRRNKAYPSYGLYTLADSPGRPQLRPRCQSQKSRMVHAPVSKGAAKPRAAMAPRASSKAGTSTIKTEAAPTVRIRGLSKRTCSSVDCAQRPGARYCGRQRLRAQVLAQAIAGVGADNRGRVRLLFEDVWPSRGHGKRSGGGVGKRRMVQELECSASAAILAVHEPGTPQRAHLPALCACATPSVLQSIAPSSARCARASRLTRTSAPGKV